MADKGSHRLRVAEWVAIIWLAIIGFAAVFGPLLPLQDPTAQGECTTKQPKRELDASGSPVVVDGKYRLIPQPGCDFQKAADDRSAAKPSSAHLLGNDQIGRDLLSRVVAGARTSIFVSVGSVLAALVIGGGIGMVSAYVGGRVDAAITLLSAAMVALPGLVLAISFVAALGRTMFAVWAALTVGAIPMVALVSRIQSLSLIQREYVVAAKALGATHSRVLLREVLPNLLPFAYVFIGLGFAGAVAAEGGLALIGLSVDQPATSWGAIIGDGKALLETAPHISLIPSAVMFLTIWAATRITDHLTDRLGVRASAL